MTESMYGRTSGFWNSIFFAVQGPMNTTRQGEDVLLIYFAMVAAGERFAEMCGAMSGLDVVHERGAAGRGEEPLFLELFRLFERHHVRAESGFHHVEEAELADARHHLTEFCVGELAGHGGSDDGVHLIFAVAVALLDHVDDVEDIALVYDGAEGTLILQAYSQGRRRETMAL